VAVVSRGQVYRARLATGQEVAVKVQRPGLVAQIAVDVAVLHYLARGLARWSTLLRVVDWQGMLKEFHNTLLIELDYEQEAQHAERFRRHFARWPDVYVPRIYHELSTRRVLVMAYVTGFKVTGTTQLTAPGLDPPGHGGGARPQKSREALGADLPQAAAGRRLLSRRSASGQPSGDAGRAAGLLRFWHGRPAATGAASAPARGLPPPRRAQCARVGGGLAASRTLGVHPRGGDARDAYPHSPHRALSASASGGHPVESLALRAGSNADGTAGAHSC